MLYGMKIANLAYVTKTRVRFFSLDPWVSVQLPEKKRPMKLGSDISKQHKSLLAKIFYDRCVHARVCVCVCVCRWDSMGGAGGRGNSGLPQVVVNPAPSGSGRKLVGWGKVT
jgi:hypothetical protein